MYCEVCGKKFYGWRGYNKHWYFTHRNKDNNYKYCVYCRKVLGINYCYCNFCNKNYRCEKCCKNIKSCYT